MSVSHFFKLCTQAIATQFKNQRDAYFCQPMADDQMPLRAELFSADQMEQHGKNLASLHHTLNKLNTHNQLLSRLNENEQIILKAYTLLTSVVKSKIRISPAGEWLFDNFYLIEEQIRTAKLHFPKSYSRELPCLAEGPSAKLPRVYDLALEIISHGDGRVDTETLNRFVLAYQSITPLLVGELWAIPIMLRLALIENLRRISTGITTARSHSAQAQEWAKQMMNTAECDPKNLILVIADMARSNPPMTSSFIAELARHLQGHGKALALPLTWIEQQLAESNLTIEHMVQSETQRQAAEQVSISNTISSLRSLSAIDWHVFVESMSLVEQILRTDINDVYREMDFATRDRYRHVITHLARHSHLSEIDIAHAAIELSHEKAANPGKAANQGKNEHTAHVGYYLIDQGLLQLECAIKVQLPRITLLRRFLHQYPLTLYLGSMLLMIAIFTNILLVQWYHDGMRGLSLVLLGIVSLLAISHLASSLTNWFATLLVSPQKLPRMDFYDGIPSNLCTLAVIPTLLTGRQEIDDLLEKIEVQFLGNRDEHVLFGLLTDFSDAQIKTCAEDESLLQQIQIGIEKLNEKYRREKNTAFFLFHRPRHWNPSERRWMAYERKRGKLADLNAALRGNGWDRFSLVVGNRDSLSNIKYVITLDTDTHLPRDCARQLVSVMAHPLNHPRFDESKQRVSGGYGILQPRMATSLSLANQSRYAQLCGSEPGIDPYTRSTSDVYQDLFGEGSFIGKGIYDVDAFEKSLKERLPENRILSHDLLEGCYARSGLLSDVQLFEDYPARYQADVKRQERWMRGDWQIAHWLLPNVPGFNDERLPNPLSLLSRWKIFDNLRRSLVPTALLLILLLGWHFSAQPYLWTLIVMGIIFIHAFLSSILTTIRKPENLFFSQHLTTVLQSLGQSLSLGGLKIACLPHQALFSLNAILQTAWRVFITHYRMLDWSTSSEQNHLKDNGVIASYRSMWIAPFTAILVIMSHPFNSDALIAASPILLLWLIAPGIVWWLSQPLTQHEVHLTAEQNLFLRKIARKTWGFFEHFVTVEDHWLPPDNFQENPDPIIAHRTSPTNIGLALLANLSAYDFGYISAGLLIKRTTNTLNTMAKLSRYHGHFFNWYDTQSLEPLLPRYISSVDSGNLAGHLLTLHSGFLVLPDQNIISPRVFEGLSDTLNILIDDLSDNTSPSIAPLHLLLKEIAAQPPTTLLMVMHHFEQLLNHATVLDHQVRLLNNQATPWISILVQQCQALLNELIFLAPWLSLPTTSLSPTAPQGLSLLTEFSNTLTLRELKERTTKLLPNIEKKLNDILTQEEKIWLNELRNLMIISCERATEQIAMCEQIAQQAAAFATMKYDFLYDDARRLLSIGYNVDSLRRDNSFYDLLASEARLCSFVAIAQGELPQESWFALGRLMTTTEHKQVLMSWSGSMFEYLMPLLIMPNYENTLLDQTYQAAVARQIAYGAESSLPWGISESAYNSVDISLTYQYHAFGVPGLGLKQGLAKDVVVTPYASALALMVAPEAACENLQRLSAIGLESRFGFFEAIDYTSSRLTSGQLSVVVRAYMAHHQGMNLLSLAYLLLNQPMQKRFESHPSFQATLLLLQERIPKTSVFKKRSSEPLDDSAFFDISEVSIQAPIGANTLIPEVQLLSNGHYHVMVTNTGGGYSRWNDLAMTRWREDSTCDHWGTFIYLRDVNSGEFWSAAHQPTLKKAQSYDVVFGEGRAEYRRRDHDIETYSQIVVSPEDDIELRRVCITNHSNSPKTIELTTYAEVVLAVPAAEMMQPAFNNLFIQTEIIDAHHAILCTRRPRSTAEQTPWMFHLLVAHGIDLNEVSYETDRIRFIGRGQTLATPCVMNNSAALSGTAGSVLDPIVAIRCQITLKAQQSASIDFVFGAAASREMCLALVEKYQDRHLADRVFDLALTHCNVTLRQINASKSDAQLYRRLAGSVLYANAALRAETGILTKNQRGQSGLWGYAISGDLPIVLLKIADIAHIELARQLIQCHAYWRLKGLTVDLVIWNEDHNGYRKILHDHIMGLIATGTEANAIDRPGGIFVRSSEQISNEDRILLQTVARIIITDSDGGLLKQMNHRVLRDKKMPRLSPTRIHRSEPAAIADAPRQDLILNNGLGGFNQEGSEYIITTTLTQMTPLPWVNVIANPNFGTVISEAGLAYTFSENAHEFRLTPWSDDLIGTSGGEAIYLRDEESGHYWSPSPLPCRGAMPYVSRHGFGYSVFEHTAGGIHSELWIYVDLEAAIKFSVLKVRNGSGRARRLSAIGYVEWVLGDLRTKSAMHVVTAIDAASGALFARNAYNTAFAGRVAFFDVDDMSRTLTGDRTEFLGRNGTLTSPDALNRSRLSGKVGAGFDPCGALQVSLDLADGQEREIIFRLGVGKNHHEACELVQRFRKTGSARNALENVKQYWKHTLCAVQIQTPDVSLNVLANGWLIYQTLACRLWARSGFYQSGGAFGFRDQLQDVMALMHAEPQLVRQHLLRSAARQFPEGDVQHWWHPPSGQGVRTRCSDDYLWLPLAVCRYTVTTGDHSVLDELVPFLEGRALNAEEESYYDLLGQSQETASLYQHCVRAILYGLRFGEHGLPLMGSGDWNDGMNLVGIEGKGESVWLGFFLYKVLESFAELAQIKGDSVFTERCHEEAKKLKLNIAQHAWDGAWYLRAYFDDGSLLGSEQNTECKIDSIAQSWSVLSGASDVERCRMAMESMDKHLVRRDEHLIQLLHPPFDQSMMNPGYIKGYVPGVRENGGQYTHAAVWAAMAFAKLGDNHRAWELLSLMNPLNHTQTQADVAIYKTEPYVVAADIYAAAPHVGRGGWTWYTGSAGWLYQLILESLLGLKREANKLTIVPCIPKDWTTYSINYRYGDTLYQITITQAIGTKNDIKIMLDGIVQNEGVLLVDDHQKHWVEVKITTWHYSSLIR